MRLLLGALLLIGCNNNSPAPVPDLSMAASGDMAMAPAPDMATAAGDMAMASGDMASGGMVTLTLENYLSWCTVSVNGGAGSTVATQTLQFPSGTVVNLSGDKASNVFVWGYWFGTDGDVNAGHDKSMATTVTMSGDKKVQACCPFATSPNTPCPPPT